MMLLLAWRATAKERERECGFRQKFNKNNHLVSGKTKITDPTALASNNVAVTKNEHLEKRFFRNGFNSS